MNVTRSSDSSVDLIVGLGNPGSEYEHSRHNAGFMVIERLLAGFPAGRFEETRISESRLFSGRFRGRNLYLQMPLTYMNLSGNAVAGFCRKAQIQPERVLVVLDDMDLELGRIKLRNGGSAGGHHGLESVTAMLGTCRIKRLRVGIGHPGSGKTVDYVLSGFEGAPGAETAAPCLSASATSARASGTAFFASSMAITGTTPIREIVCRTSFICKPSSF